MIERKRRNDFVRKREFDMLRKMRRREAMAGQDPAARPSFFQSSLPSKPDDRAMTLKKIDEIEAQMSMQWWKTKHGDSSIRSNFPQSSHSPQNDRAHPSSKPPLPPPPGSANAAYARTDPAPLQSPRPKPPLGMPPAPVRSSSPVAQAGAAPQVGGLAGSYDGAATGFSASKLFAIEIDEFAHDPELEEASIRFANGDDAGAEAGLMEALGPTGTRKDHDETWMTLFDLYRATGQHDRFESAAIDFAGRFGRSAPQWFSIPEMVGRMAAAPSSGGAAPSASQQAPDWTSASSLGTQSLAMLNAALARAPQPWRLDWAKLVTIENGAIEPLRKLFAGWGAQPVQLRFIGADNLDKVLQAATPSGDKSGSQEWWRLRMENLRITHRPDEFELVALDYCVTYEVSPPSWESARCEYKPLNPDGGYMPGHTIIGEAFHDSMPSSPSSAYGDTQMPSMSSQMAQVSTVELAGHIVGDATAALDKLEARLMGADIMVISCAKLIRVDFSAAGTLLNWVTSRQAEGRQVQFSEVHRLVAAFFNVIGISEHARVSPRTD